jgi:response regulator RpfG family c-di-GMP phosphodiesterase
VTLDKILCVDDEPNVTGGLTLQLKRLYDVSVAINGDQGLRILKDRGPFAVVLSDMRMPGMSGAAFLAKVREESPDTTRMLLTGHTDMEMAISAVNDGQIFRFLMKPCPPIQLRAAFEAAARQYHLTTSERVLLEQTLHGSIKALVDVLSLTNPVSFGRASRVKRLAAWLAAELDLADRWQVEVAAMLSQLSCITLPAETVQRLYVDAPLSDAERTMVGRLPRVTDQLLQHIPRLEAVREILARATSPRGCKGLPSPDQAERRLQDAADVLRVALDFDELHTQGRAPKVAVTEMSRRDRTYDSRILGILEKKGVATFEQAEVYELPLSALRPGMVLAEDALLMTGNVLAARGYEVTVGFLERVKNFGPGAVHEPIRVIQADEPGAIGAKP